MALVEVSLPSDEAIAAPVFAIVSAEARAAHASIWPSRHDDFGPDLQGLMAIPAPDGDTTIAGPARHGRLQAADAQGVRRRRPAGVADHAGGGAADRGRCRCALAGLTCR